MKSNQSFKILFPSQRALPQRVPQTVWRLAQLIAVLILAGLCALLLIQPEQGLFAFWHIAVPVLPLLFLIAPGVWSNICPIATASQVPAMMGFSRLQTLPAALRNHSMWVSAGLLFLLVPSRKIVFNSDAAALAGLFATFVVIAFIMGWIFKGKSGWCTSFCPVFPVERLYGQTPFVPTRNAHCEPCRACTSHCYDRNAPIAWLEEQFRSEAGAGRALGGFAAMFPGLIVAYYTSGEAAQWPASDLYGYFAICAGASLAVWLALKAVPRLHSGLRTALFTIVAINLYYWFNAPQLAELFPASHGMTFVWFLRAAVLVLSLVWLVRTYRLQQRYRQLIVNEPAGS